MWRGSDVDPGGVVGEWRLLHHQWQKGVANVRFGCQVHRIVCQYGAPSVSAFIIDTDAPGFRRGKTEPKPGIRASATREIEFDDYKCLVENRLGEEGQGFRIALIVLDTSRIGIAAQAPGIAQAAYEAAVIYSRERKAFGSFQMIRNRMQT